MKYLHLSPCHLVTLSSSQQPIQRRASSCALAQICSASAASPPSRSAAAQSAIWSSCGRSSSIGQRDQLLVARQQRRDRLALLVQRKLIFDPRQHLFDLKRLGDVIHPADLKRLDFVQHVVQRADKDHRDVAGLRDRP